MMQSQKIGRNDPCPCGALKPDGSPIKYKKHCGKSEKPPPNQEEILRIAQEVLMKKQQQERALADKGIFINYVNPATYTHPKTGERVKAWALGHRLFHTRPEHETFAAFIISHLQREVLGKEWWEEQEKSEAKHFLYQCFQKYDEWCIRNVTEQNRVNEHIWGAVPDGWVKTLSSLAFDVCTLEHTKKLPDHLVNRLKNRGEYQGAHFEIAVAAIFARLGCSIEFFDDKKLFTPHPEFIATHHQTGVSVAVEAKSRQRRGVKHREGTATQDELLRGDVEGLLKKALAQNQNDRPFIVFIDVNAPLTPSTPMELKPWYKDIRSFMDANPAPNPENPEKYTGIFFTNFSPHYNGENLSDPNEYLAVIPRYAAHPMPNAAFGEMLMRAVQNYGFVPNIQEDDNTY